MSDEITLQPQALAEIDVVQLRTDIAQLRAGLRAVIDRYLTETETVPTAWVGLVVTLGHEVGEVLGALKLMPDAPEVMHNAINRAVFRGETDPDRAGDRPVDANAVGVLTNDFLSAISRHLRAADARDAHVYEALAALAAATTVVLRVADRDAAARRFFEGALASGQLQPGASGQLQPGASGQLQPGAGGPLQPGTDGRLQAGAFSPGRGA